MGMRETTKTPRPRAVWLPEQQSCYLSFLERSKAIPADERGRPALLGPPRGCHLGSQALRGGTVDHLQPGLEGQAPARKEAVRAQVQRAGLWGTGYELSHQSYPHTAVSLPGSPYPGRLHVARQLTRSLTNYRS